MRFHTQSEKETYTLAKRFANKLRGGDVLLLKGELGAGKTTFVKGLARALKVSAKIKSPTFVLMQVHKVRPNNKKTKQLNNNGVVQSFSRSVIKYLVHVDAYRVKGAQALKEVGLMEWIGRPDSVVVIEWGEKVKTLSKKARRVWNLSFLHGKSEQERVIKVRHG